MRETTGSGCPNDCFGLGDLGTTTDGEEDRIRGGETALGRDRDGDSETVGSGDLEKDGTGLIGFASELERYRSIDAGVINGLILSLVMLTTEALVGVGLGDLVIGEQDFSLELVNFAEGLPSLKPQRSSPPGAAVVVTV